MKWSYPRSLPQVVFVLRAACLPVSPSPVSLNVSRPRSPPRSRTGLQRTRRSARRARVEPSRAAHGLLALRPRRRPACIGLDRGARLVLRQGDSLRGESVSYTHLTLPTSDLV